jgi:hypothetical protein
LRQSRHAIGGMKLMKLDRQLGFMLKSNADKKPPFVGGFVPLLFICNQSFTEEVGIFCESQEKIE